VRAVFLRPIRGQSDGAHRPAAAGLLPGQSEKALRSLLFSRLRTRLRGAIHPTRGGLRPPRWADEPLRQTDSNNLRNDAVDRIQSAPKYRRLLSRNGRQLDAGTRWTVRGDDPENERALCLIEHRRRERRGRHRRARLSCRFRSMGTTGSHARISSPTFSRIEPNLHGMTGCLRQMGDLDRCSGLPSRRRVPPRPFDLPFRADRAQPRRSNGGSGLPIISARSFVGGMNFYPPFPSARIEQEWLLSRRTVASKFESDAMCRNSHEPTLAPRLIQRQLLQIPPMITRVEDAAGSVNCPIIRLKNSVVHGGVSRLIAYSFSRRRTWYRIELNQIR